MGRCKEWIRGLRDGRLAAIACVLTLLFAGLSTSLMAQVDQGTITGVISDSSGAVIAGAAVTVRNVDTGFTLSDKTDDRGVYTFSPVKIGNYSVSATAPGFSTTTQEKVQVHVGERVGIDVKLTSGEVSTTVEVTTAAPLLQTEDGSTGQVISAQTIVDTPLNGRNFVFIAQLSAGIAPGNGSRGQGKGDFSANGQRSEQNNFILDGVDNNVNVVDFFNGASFNIKPPPEAIAEFKVQTGAFSAEYGHSAGAVINTSIKSGTNGFHGGAWEYIRNDAFNVHQWIDNPGVVQKYRQNQFGGTFGGPIIKNKLFFFGDAEANRIIFGETGTFNVPTALMRTGNFSELLNPALTNSTAVQLVQPNSASISRPLVNNTLAPSQINPNALRLLNLFPLPNANGGKTFSNYIPTRNATDNTLQYDVRVDYNATQHDQAFARYSYSDDPGTRTPPLGNILDGGSFGDTGTIVNRSQAFAFSETHIFNPNLSNEARFGYNYGNFGFQHPNINTELSPTYGLGGIPFGQLNGGLPFFSVGGVSNFGSPQFSVTNEYQNVYQILDNVTKVLGAHTLRGGVNFQHIRASTTQPTQSRGTYTYTGKFTSVPTPPKNAPMGINFTGYGIADFLTNNMDSAAISNIATTDDVRWIRAGYFQDDWKATDRLTLNLGLRYEYAQPYLERHDNQANFYPTSQGVGRGSGVYLIPSSKRGVALSPKFLTLLQQNNIQLQYSNNRFLTEPQKTNFAPRFGLAYRVTDKLIARGGYGIFFGGLESTGYFPNLGENYPFQFDSGFNSNVNVCVPGNCANNGIALETGFAAQIAAGLGNSIQTPALRGSDPQVKTPYSQQYNLSTEYAVTNNMSATVAYVGSLGRHLIVFPDQNSSAALVGPGDSAANVRPFKDFGGTAYSQYSGSSNYNSLQAKLDRRFNNGLSFLASYTYSHSLDNAPTPLGSTGDSGYRNALLTGIGADYSNSPFDVRQRFTFNGTYQIPYGVGRRYGNHQGILNQVLGGWSNTLTFRAQTGQPFSMGTSTPTANGAGAHAIRIRDPFQGGGTPDPSRTDLPAGFTCPTEVRTTQNWYNPCAFINPPLASTVQVGVTGYSALAYLGAPRNTVYGPGYERIDGSLFKNFTFYKEANFQLRMDYFNLLNTPAYGNPSGGIGSGGGQINSQRNLGLFNPDSRFFQFAAKVNF